MSSLRAVSGFRSRMEFEWTCVVANAGASVLCRSVASCDLLDAGSIAPHRPRIKCHCVRDVAGRRVCPWHRQDSPVWVHRRKPFRWARKSGHFLGRTLLGWICLGCQARRKQQGPDNSASTDGNVREPTVTCLRSQRRTTYQFDMRANRGLFPLPLPVRPDTGSGRPGHPGAYLFLPCPISF